MRKRLRTMGPSLEEQSMSYLWIDRSGGGSVESAVFLMRVLVGRSGKVMVWAVENAVGREAAGAAGVLAES